MSYLSNDFVATHCRRPARGCCLGLSRSIAKRLPSGGKTMRPSRRRNRGLLFRFCALQPLISHQTRNWVERRDVGSLVFHALVVFWGGAGLMLVPSAILEGGSEPSVDHTAYQLMGGSDLIDRIGGLRVCSHRFVLSESQYRFQVSVLSVNEMVTGSTGAWGYIDGVFFFAVPLTSKLPLAFCLNLFSSPSETYNSPYVFVVRGIIE